ncbi:MAG: hypothetical protein C0608_08330 [Deltaproteobacteria bacterium]|nr:MAG: hypothetical protein C0608_08330 [Deltaproteobacteria bacterium]
MLSPVERKIALEIARGAIASHLDGNPLPPKESLGIPISSTSFDEPFATFVTLKKKHQLRGCIGNIIARHPLWKSLQENALSAAFADPRFPTLSKEEFGEVSIEVSILTRPIKIASFREFEVGKHGIILEYGRSGAVFLPQVAVEQGWSREETLSHLSLKAGLSGNAWASEDARFEVFEAEVFGEGKVP